MTFLAFFLPLFLFYSLFMISLGAGLVACVGSWRRRRRHPWVLVASLLAILAGIGLNVYYQSILWSAAEGAWWFTMLGLAPIPLGLVGLERWFLLKV